MANRRSADQPQRSTAPEFSQTLDAEEDAATALDEENDWRYTQALGDRIREDVARAVSDRQLMWQCNVLCITHDVPQWSKQSTPASNNGPSAPIKRPSDFSPMKMSTPSDVLPYRRVMENDIKRSVDLIQIFREIASRFPCFRSPIHTRRLYQC